MYDFIIPKMGQEDSEVEIMSIKVKVGDRVEVGDPIVEIESEKATTVLEAEEPGVINEILMNEGDVGQIGDVFCRISEE